MSYSPARDCIVNANRFTYRQLCMVCVGSLMFDHAVLIGSSDWIFCCQIALSLCSRKMFVSRKEGTCSPRILRVNLFRILCRGGRFRSGPPGFQNTTGWNRVHNTLAVAWEGCGLIVRMYAMARAIHCSNPNYAVGGRSWWHRWCLLRICGFVRKKRDWLLWD